MDQSKRRLLLGETTVSATVPRGGSNRGQTASYGDLLRAQEEALAEAAAELGPEGTPAYKRIPWSRVTKEDVREAMRGINGTPTVAPDRPTVWVFYLVGDEASDRHLGDVIPALKTYADVVHAEYFAVLDTTQLQLAQRPVRFESNWAASVEAAPDIGGRTAAEYAGGHHNSTVWVWRGSRELLARGELAERLAALFGERAGLPSGSRGR
ncbi:hypothetical protein JN531_016690 (plasmid) [Flagellatimonas centrodinii]|uniref:hypothetical protein n=1 Tax=Flagellatimonas centrodinii TaxID=2806210 RepID=UPI001FFA7B1D|nr:hypothetical protein [Flagellatimonas centrodinii]ULQ48415.1 hypothetical protein JN531_016690 [Flagellatimonas centrodinii]